MNTRILIAATFLGITACATSGQESRGPATNTENPVANTQEPEAADQLEVAEVPEVPVAAAPASSGNEIVCRKERHVGSHLPVKVCRTRAQMDAEREAGQDTLDSLSRRTYSGPDRISVNE